MSLPALFINRPVATALLAIGILISGVVSFLLLPVAPLPQVDLPTISVNASLPGASPETMASSVATPLERRLGVIPAVTEMTSQSRTGSTSITLQFDLSRDINGAARDVQAAINAARADLPTTLRSNPTYRKVNPSDSPVIVLALTSDTRTPQQIFDAASVILQQRLLQLNGVGDIELGGGALPAVRVELNPFALAQLGISFEDVRAAIAAAQGNRPKGIVEGSDQRYVIYTSAQMRTAADYRPIIIAWRNGAPVRLSDVANLRDGPEDRRTVGLWNGKPAVVALVFREPGANIIETVDGVQAQILALQAALPADIKLVVSHERTRTIRASLHEVEIALGVAIVLVILVVAAFLRSWRATVVPGVAIVTSLMGTLSAMYLLGYTLDNLSLMALVIVTGFVVDDAIVVLENIARHIEEGKDRKTAALLGAKEVSFTVVSMSLSLVAVFIPLLFMGGVVGRLFSQFAVVLAVSILISLVISLSVTPALAARILPEKSVQPGRIAQALERGFRSIERRYAHALDWALGHRRLVLVMLAAAIGLNAYLFTKIPGGFFPQVDTGQMAGGIRADQSIAFEAMQEKLTKLANTVKADPAVQSVVAFAGGRRGSGFMFVSLTPDPDRPSSEDVINRLRPKLGAETGVNIILNPVQDLRVGGRGSPSSFQYTMVSDDAQLLRIWSKRLAEAMRGSKMFVDVDADLEDRGVEQSVVIDQDAAARLGLSNRAISNTLYNAFGQRQVATIYNEVNQYRVVMEVDPRFARDPSALQNIYIGGRAGSGVSASAFAPEGGSVSAQSAVSAGPSVQQPGAGPANALAPAISAAASGATGGASSGTALSTTAQRSVPLATIATSGLGAAPTSINHQNVDAASTISFNTAPGKALSDAQAEIDRLEREIGMPPGVRGDFAGTAKVFRESQKNMPYLFLAAFLVIYIVLGILYESMIHPLTVLSTLPSAGVGAFMALMAAGMPLDLIGIIALTLLIGIVMKNAILIIDFALHAEREHGKNSLEAIREGALLRFRPIIMTTIAAIFGAVPLAIGFGEGSELRQPLGIAIIGGLVASQLLTLITTPVVYLYLDRLRRHPRARPAAQHGYASEAIPAE